MTSQEKYFASLKKIPLLLVISWASIAIITIELFRLTTIDVCKASSENEYKVEER